MLRTPGLISMPMCSTGSDSCGNGEVTGPESGGVSACGGVSDCVGVSVCGGVSGSGSGAGAGCVTTGETPLTMSV
jgi:hypothetical protein